MRYYIAIALTLLILYFLMIQNRYFDEHYKKVREAQCDKTADLHDAVSNFEALAIQCSQLQ